ncbi:hypothetical protein ACGGZK_06500 [Agromyces sp. MMS24-K17]|uniref:hypothetical protein n=1 Tax=Agromyces sp. MMS24-K17 TaxID=3372850 RepID=UPI0037542579
MTEKQTTIAQPQDPKATMRLSRLLLIVGAVWIVIALVIFVVAGDQLWVNANSEGSRAMVPGLFAVVGLVVGITNFLVWGPRYRKAKAQLEAGSEAAPAA